jgi:hypothetical protein
MATNARVVALGLVVTFTAYFPAAIWLQSSYVRIEAPAGAVFKLTQFLRLSRNKFGYMSIAHKLRDLGDTEDEPKRSPVIIYEDGLPLGPAHSAQEDIEEIGLGRFSHLQRIGFFLSASDYWIVLPKAIVSEVPRK